MRAHSLAVAANTPSGISPPAQAMPAGPSQMTNLQRGSPGPERHLVARPDRRSACGDGPGGSGHRGGVAGAVHQQAADRARRPAGEVLAPLGPATCSTADPLPSAGTALPCHGGYVWALWSRASSRMAMWRSSRASSSSWAAVRRARVGCQRREGPAGSHPVCVAALSAAGSGCVAAYERELTNERAAAVATGRPSGRHAGTPAGRPG